MFFKVQRVLAIGFVILACGTPSQASSESHFNQLADAIYLAEGPKHPYGILSVKVSSKAEARQTCIDVIRYRYLLWASSDICRQEDFISYLSKSYCPIGAKNDHKGLNRHWKSNVERLMK